MGDIINFTSYNAAETIIEQQGSALYYSNLRTAIDSHPGWSVIEGSKVTTMGETAGSPKIVPISNYIKTEAELEGGVVGATEAIQIAETGVGTEVAAGASGLFAGWTIGTAVAGALAGAGIGIAMYDTNPQFWVDVSNRLFPGEDINYEDIKDYTIVGLIKESIFGTDEELTTYLSEDVVKKILDVASEYNLFSHHYESHVEDTSPLRYPNNLRQPVLYVLGDKHTTGEQVLEIVNSTSKVCSCRVLPTGYSEVYYACSENPFSVKQGGITRNATAYEHNGLTYYCIQYYPGRWTATDLPRNNYTYPGNDNWVWDFAYVMMNGETSYVGGEGTYELPDAPKIYNPNQPLNLQYPEWLARLINTNGIQLPYDDPSLYPIPWIPVQMPEFDPITTPERYPAPYPSPQPSPEPQPYAPPYPNKDPQPEAQRGRGREPYVLPDPNRNPTNDLPKKNPDDGDDKPDDKNPPTDPTPTPPIVFPTFGGEANALFTVYNPIVAELNQLAGVLWSNNFIENLIKIFTNNPMDAIISLHMLYATPHTGGRKNIKLGCLDTGIGSTVVDKQYIQVDCGTVRIPEYFGDVRDYVNSVVDVYLPFVGMRHLKTQDIVGSYVTIKAGIDVFTGTILYTINIRKTSGIDQVMYAFEGNCAVALPLTGADKSRMFSVLGAAATGAAIGGPAGAAVGAFGSVMNGSQQADIQRSGNFGANSGAMGVKKPYIVVSRNIGYDATNYNQYHGYPANKTVTLSSCSGFTRVLDIKLGSIPDATREEMVEIETLLKQGVIF